MSNNPSDPDAVDDIIAYHDRTKHHPQRYALGPGGLDWATQPNPFLRINPYSGNLHPTEAYAVLPALEWLPGGAGVYHYAPLDHALEQRARRSQGTNLDAIGFCVGLTSITWREAWKYGKRAFRYCQHDVGHAFAALHYAAAALG
jgi:SagB-type dehydrogenase family enzyme